MALGQVGHGGDGIEVARVHLSGIAHHDHRGLGAAQPSLESIQVEASDLVTRQPLDVAASESQHAHRLHHARMDVAAREHHRLGQPGQPPLLHVDPELLRPPVARGGERHEVGHRRTAGEHPAHFFGKLEQLSQPGERDLLEARRKRRRREREGALVVHRGEPVGAQRGRRATAHDEVKEAWPARARGRGPGPSGELGQRRQRSLPPFREWLVPTAQTGFRTFRHDAGTRQPGEVPACLVSREPEGGLELVSFGDRICHGRILRPARRTGAPPRKPSSCRITPT